MAEVSVTINGRDYQVACEDGQEAQVESLARYVDKKMGELVGSLGQIGDARLLVMTSLLIADELSEAYQQLDAYRSGDASKKPAPEEPATAAALEACAQRIEDIAARLESP